MSRPAETRRVIVAAEDSRPGSGGHPLLWGYGVKHLAALCGCTPKAIRCAIARGAFDPGDVLDVARYVQRCRERTDGGA